MRAAQEAAPHQSECRGEKRQRGNRARLRAGSRAIRFETRYCELSQLDHRTKRGISGSRGEPIREQCNGSAGILKATASPARSRRLRRSWIGNQ
jgi:hypothetical protein